MSDTKKKILIVDDEESIVEALSSHLKKEGFDISVAVNGKEGLEKALSEHPDLILLDIMMPVMNGIEMFKELRKDEWGKTVNIILLTILDDLQKMHEAIEHDISDYLMKPDWKMEDVSKRIKEKLGV